MSNLVVPKIKLSPLAELYELEEEVTYIYDGKSIIIPSGYKYDGASIPAIFWQEIGTPFDPYFMAAALPHDRCYDTHEQDKEWADNLLFEVLIYSGVSRIKASLIYRAVRDFGQSHWDKKTTS